MYETAVYRLHVLTVTYRKWCIYTKQQKSWTVILLQQHLASVNVLLKQYHPSWFWRQKLQTGNPIPPKIWVLEIYFIHLIRRGIFAEFTRKLLLRYGHRELAPVINTALYRHFTWPLKWMLAADWDRPVRRHLYVVPSTRRSTLGDRAFPVAAARAWNNLPASVGSAHSFAEFCQQLKTFLFHSCYGLHWFTAI